MSQFPKHEGDRATDPGARMAERQEEFPPFGAVVDVPLNTGASTDWTARHGLGRRYVGAILIGQSFNARVSMFTHEEHAARGGDPTVTFGGRVATATGTARVWVF